MSPVQAVNTVTLRPATMADAERLFAWRNDPETRRQCWQTHEVTRESHQRWLAGTLDDETVFLFIADADGTAVGTGRLDWCVMGVELSLTVAPEHRGQGIGTAIILALRAEAKRVGWTPLIAYIKPGNTASLKAFERAGFTQRRVEMCA